MPLRRQLLVALVVPAVLAIGVVAYLADLAAGEALDRALGTRLTSVAQAAATLVGPRIVVLEPGDDDTRTAKNALAKLAALRDATEVAQILVVRTKDSACLVDTQEKLQIGEEYTRARFDRPELEQVAVGKSVASVLFEGAEGRPYKTGYAPLFEGKEVVAYAAVQAPASYTDAIDALRLSMAGIALFGFVLLFGAAIWSARRVAVPLSALSGAAERIGRGEMNTQIPIGGPAEAVVLGETMRNMASSLRARDEEMQMMLAGIAHEVRNPLGGIELFGGLLKEDLEVGDPRRKHVEKILRELGVLAKVVNDFLDFARRHALEPRETDLHDVLFEVVSIAEKDAGDAEVKLSLDAPSVSAELDPDAIKRAVLNLVRNAIQAVPKGTGTVSISARDEGESVLIQVQDNGPGILDARKKEIFAPFFTTKQKGTGLGLALVRKTADAHRGTIEVHDADGGGARFVLTIPRRSPPRA